MEAFLGRELGEQGARTSGVPMSWLRVEFAQCPEEADEDIVGYYCRAWILHLFAYVLFPDATGDTTRGCGSTASLTGTRRVSTTRALQCWVLFTGNFARRVVGLCPHRHLVDACTCSSCGCGLIYLLAVLRFWLVGSGSQVSLYVGS